MRSNTDSIWIRLAAAGVVVVVLFVARYIVAGSGQAVYTDSVSQVAQPQQLGKDPGPGKVLQLPTGTDQRGAYWRTIKTLPEGAALGDVPQVTTTGTNTGWGVANLSGTVDYLPVRTTTGWGDSPVYKDGNGIVIGYKLRLIPAGDTVYLQNLDVGSFWATGAAAGPLGGAFSIAATYGLTVHASSASTFVAALRPVIGVGGGELVLKAPDENFGFFRIPSAGGNRTWIFPATQTAGRFLYDTDGNGTLGEKAITAADFLPSGAVPGQVLGVVPNTATVTAMVTSSNTGTQTATHTLTANNTGTVTGTHTETATHTETTTKTGTYTYTATGTLTDNNGSAVGTYTYSHTSTGTPTGTHTHVGTEIIAATRTLTETKTVTSTNTQTGTLTATGTTTGTYTLTATGTTTATGTETVTYTYPTSSSATAIGTGTGTDWKATWRPTESQIGSYYLTSYPCEGDCLGAFKTDQLRAGTVTPTNRTWSANCSSGSDGAIGEFAVTTSLIGGAGPIWPAGLWAGFIKAGSTGPAQIRIEVWEDGVGKWFDFSTWQFSGGPQVVYGASVKEQRIPASPTHDVYFVLYAVCSTPATVTFYSDTSLESRIETPLHTYRTKAAQIQYSGQFCNGSWVGNVDEALACLESRPSLPAGNVGDFDVVSGSGTGTSDTRTTKTVTLAAEDPFRWKYTGTTGTSTATGTATGTGVNIGTASTPTLTMLPAPVTFACSSISTDQTLSSALTLGYSAGTVVSVGPITPRASTTALRVKFHFFGKGVSATDPVLAEVEAHTSSPDNYMWVPKAFFATTSSVGGYMSGSADVVAWDSSWASATTYNLRMSSVVMNFQTGGAFACLEIEEIKK